MLLALLTLLSSSHAIPAHLSSKTIYEAVRGDINNVPPPIPSCQPQQLYFLLRHGSRNFGTTTTDRIELFLDQLRKNVTKGTVVLPPSLDWFKTWKQGVYYKNYDLVREGMLEHYNIGMRFKSRFPSLFPEYFIDNYSLQATYKQRAIQSALAFMYGILQDTGPLKQGSDRLNLSTVGYLPPGILIKSKHEDKLLRFMDNCPRYTAYIDSLKWKDEMFMFEQSEVYLTAMASLSIAANMSLSIHTAKALYYLCAIELMSPSQANYSKFCNVISEEVMLVYDYSKDLEKYYEYSYPFPLSSQMSCLLLKDVIEQLNSSSSKPVLKFAHEETVMPLVTLLGLYNDGEILKHNTTGFLKRKMKISTITPFAGNIAFVRYKCGNEALIQVIINEKVQHVPYCSPQGCSITQLQNILTTNAGDCDFDTMCGVTDPSDTPSFLYAAIAALLTLLLVESTYIFFHCIKRSSLCVEKQPNVAQRLLSEDYYEGSNEDEDEL